MPRNNSHVRFIFAILAALSFGSMACGVGYSPEDGLPQHAEEVGEALLPQCSAEEGCQGGSESCRSTSLCPNWGTHCTKTPCLVEQYTSTTAKTYCIQHDGSPCGAVRRFFFNGDGACIGEEFIAGEALTSCG